MAVGSIMGSATLRPSTPLLAAVVATLIILTIALSVDVLHARGWLPAKYVHAQPVLLYANGKLSAIASH